MDASTRLLASGLVFGGSAAAAGGATAAAALIAAALVVLFVDFEGGEFSLFSDGVSQASSRLASAACFLVESLTFVLFSRNGLSIADLVALGRLTLLCHGQASS